MKHLQNVGQLILLATSIHILSATRSFLRSQDPMPEIHISYLTPKAQEHMISNPHLQVGSIFEPGFFDKQDFYDHLLPHGDIAYRADKSKSVSGQALNVQLELLMKEIEEKKKEYTHFTILKGREFYPDQKRGFLVVKFKEYPFVVKIFIETPEFAFVPQERGLQAYAMYIMNGGLGRFEVGFCRVKNRCELCKRIAEDPLWSVLLDVPDKHFWLGRNTPWMQIKGYNFGTKQTLYTKVPAVYAVIADWIDVDGHMALSSRGDTQLCLEICRSLGFCIDPNISNFVLEKSTTEDVARQAERLVAFDKYAKDRLTPAACKRARRIIEENKRLVIIDTENFQDLVGLHEIDFDVHNYLAWYVKLGKKFLEDKFFTLKSQRRVLRTGRTNKLQRRRILRSTARRDGR